MEARSASEVVAVTVGGSSDLAHAASPAWGIPVLLAAVLLQLTPSPTLTSQPPRQLPNWSVSADPREF